MSIIYSYPIKGTPANDDLILISDSASSPQFATKQIKVSSLPGGSSSGVSSFNTLTGAVTITGGTNVTLNPVGNNIEINAAGGSSGISVQGAGGTPITGITTLNFRHNFAVGAVGTTATMDVLPYGNDTEIQFKNGTAFGASSNLTYGSDTLTVQDNIIIKGDGSAEASKLRFNCWNNNHYVDVIGPDHADSPLSYSITLPNKIATQSAVSGGRVLEVNASGVGNWITTPASTAPQGDDGQYQYKNGSSFAGSDALRFDADKIHIGKGGGTPTRGQLVMYGDGTNASDIQLYNSGNNRFLKLAQQAGATADLTLTFPGVAPGGNTRILQSDSTGQLSWIDTPSGSGISFNGTTANGIATYSDASTANVSSNLTIDNTNKKLSIGSTYSIQDSTAVFKIGSLSTTQQQESIEFHINGAQKVKVDEDGRLVSSVGTAANPNLKFGTGNDGIYGTSNTVQIVTNGTSKISVADGNTADIQMNDLVEFGYGLRFGATGETLSSYEEGTWTPAAYAAAGAAPTVTGAAGTYVNTGKMVIANFYMTITSYSAYNVNMIISGLPYAAGTANGSFGGVSLYSNNGQSYIQQQPTSGYVNGSSIYLMRPTSTSNPILINASWYAQAAFAGNYTIAGTATYKQA